MKLEKIEAKEYSNIDELDDWDNIPNEIKKKIIALIKVRNKMDKRNEILIKALEKKYGKEHGLTIERHIGDWLA